MINLDEEMAREYLLECGEHITTIKAGFLALKNGGSEIDENRINTVLRAVHSIVGGRLFDLTAIPQLAQKMEDVLALIRSRKMALSAHRILILQRAADTLQELIQDPRASNQTDITEVMTDLDGLHLDNSAIAKRSRVAPGSAGAPQQRSIRALLVEDDVASRLLLQTFLSQYGSCDIAVNGKEAVEAFRVALEKGQRYDLVCMDIMLPEMDGREALRQIRALENGPGLRKAPGAKIIMTTATNDAQEVFRCFRESCNAYLLKPIDLTRLLGHMKSYQLVA